MPSEASQPLRGKGEATASAVCLALEGPESQLQHPWAKSVVLHADVISRFSDIIPLLESVRLEAMDFRELRCKAIKAWKQE